MLWGLSCGYGNSRCDSKGIVGVEVSVVVVVGCSEFILGMVVGCSEVILGVEVRVVVGFELWVWE